MPAIKEESSGNSPRPPTTSSNQLPNQATNQFTSLLRSQAASPSESLASLVADNGSIMEESLPEMVRLYRAKLSAIDDDELSESLLEDFDRILVLKNKRLWKVTQHLTQKMKETAEFYRAIVDNKEYQLQLYRNRIKALVQQLLDVLSTTENQDQLAPELMNPFLMNILTELSAGDATPPMMDTRRDSNHVNADGGYGTAASNHVAREPSHRSLLAESHQRVLRIPNCLLPEKLLCRPNGKKRDKL